MTKGKRGKEKEHSLMIPDTLWKRLQKHGRAEGEPVEPFIRQLLADHVDLLDKYAPYIQNGKYKKRK